MFYYVSGTVAHVEPYLAVIDCGGVGYRLTVSQNTLAALDRASARESKVKLYTYMAVREDDVELFGFYTEEELTTFRQLIGVSGIGPKAAMGVYLCESKVAERSGAQFQICFVNRHFAAAHGFKKVFYFVVHSLYVVLSEQRSLISAQGQASLYRNILAVH